MRTLLMALALAGLTIATSAASCPPKSPNPVVARAQTAVQVLQRDKELQDAAIAANGLTPKALSDADAIAIVQFTKATANAICVPVPSAPCRMVDGWVPAVKNGYAQLKLVLGSRVPTSLAGIFALLDGLFAAVN